MAKKLTPKAQEIFNRTVNIPDEVVGATSNLMLAQSAVDVPNPNAYNSGLEQQAVNQEVEKAAQSDKLIEQQNRDSETTVLDIIGAPSGRIIETAAKYTEEFDANRRAEADAFQNAFSNSNVTVQLYNKATRDEALGGIDPNFELTKEKFDKWTNGLPQEFKHMFYNVDSDAQGDILRSRFDEQLLNAKLAGDSPWASGIGMVSGFVLDPTTLAAFIAAGAVPGAGATIAGARIAKGAKVLKDAEKLIELGETTKNMAKAEAVMANYIKTQAQKDAFRANPQGFVRNLVAESQAGSISRVMEAIPSAVATGAVSGASTAFLDDGNLLLTDEQKRNNLENSIALGAVFGYGIRAYQTNKAYRNYMQKISDGISGTVSKVVVPDAVASSADDLARAASGNTVDETLAAANRSADEAAVVSNSDSIVNPNASGSRSAIADDSLSDIDSIIPNLTADAMPATSTWENSVREIFGDMADQYLGSTSSKAAKTINVKSVEDLATVKSLSDTIESSISNSISKSELNSAIRSIVPESVDEVFSVARSEITDKLLSSLAKSGYSDVDNARVALTYSMSSAIKEASDNISTQISRSIDNTVIGSSSKSLSNISESITTSVTNDIVNSVSESIARSTGREVSSEILGVILKSIEPIIKQKVRDLTSKVSNKLESLRVTNAETVGAAKGKTFGDLLSTKADDAAALDGIEKLRILGHTPASALVAANAKRLIESITKIDGVVGANMISNSNVYRGSYASSLGGGIRVPRRNAPSDAVITVNADGKVVAHLIKGKSPVDDATEVVAASETRSAEDAAEIISDEAKAAYDSTIAAGGTKAEAESAAAVADDVAEGNIDNTQSATVEAVDVVPNEMEGLASLPVKPNGNESIVTSGSAKGAINAETLDGRWNYHVAFDKANAFFSGVSAVSATRSNTLATTVMRQIEGDVTGITNTSIKGEHGLANYAMMRSAGDTTRVVEKYMPALAEEIRLKPGVNREVVMKDFDREIYLRAHGYDVIDGVPMEKITPAKQALIDEYRLVNSEHVESMMNPGKEFGKSLRPLEGASESKLMNEAGNYVHHRQNIDAFKAVATEFGVNGLMNVIKGSIKSALPTIPDGTLEAVARAYPQYALGATNTRAIRIANAASGDTKDFLREVLEASGEVSKDKIDEIIASLKGSNKSSGVDQLNRRQMFDMNYSVSLTNLAGELKTVKMTDIFETNLALLAETSSLSVHRAVSKANIVVKGIVDDTGVEKVIFDGIRKDSDRVALMSAIEQINGYKSVSIKKQKTIMKELNASLDRISGIPPEGSDSLANLYTRRLMSFAATTSSGAFGVSAVTEIMKPLATTGFRVINSLPIVRNILRDAKTGRLSDSDVEALSSITALGKEQDTQWVLLKMNRSYEHAYDAGLSNGLDKSFDNLLRKSSAGMQWLNGVQSVTKLLTRSIMHFTMHRVSKLAMELAESGASVITKNPRRWMTYGVDKEAALRIAAQTKLHSGMVNGQKSLNLHLWDDATRFEFVRIVQNIGSRSIQQGDRFRLRSQFNNPMIKLLAQFKNFAINSYAKDFLFQLHARDMESLGTFIGTSAANALSYSAIVSVKSISQEDPQKYRDDNLSPEMVSMAILSRGPQSLPLSLAGGPLFATVGLQNPNLMFKTHLSYSGQTSYGQSGGQGTDVVEALGSSAAAFRAKDIPISGYGILSSIFKGEAIDNRDLKTLGSFLMPIIGGKQAVDILIDANNPDGKFQSYQ